MLIAALLYLRERYLQYRFALELNRDRFLERITTNHLTFAQAGLDCLSYLRQILLHDTVLLVLISQAAEKPTAHTRDISGIEGQVLLPRHPHGGSIELGKMAGAAKGATASAHTAQTLGSIAGAHLPQLNTGLQGAGEFPKQCPQVNPLLRLEN